MLHIIRLTMMKKVFILPTLCFGIYSDQKSITTDEPTNASYKTGIDTIQGKMHDVMFYYRF